MLRRELSELEVDYRAGKADHRKRGSKDLADAVSGVIWCLSKSRILAMADGVLERVEAPLWSRTTVALGPAENLDAWEQAGPLESLSSGILA